MVYSVQIKRLRHEDPIDALVVRGAKRKRGDEGDDPFVFRLARTYDSEQADKRLILERRKAEASADTEHVFALADKKRQRRSSSSAGAQSTSAGPPQEGNTDLVPSELQSMIAEYITGEKPGVVALKVEESDKETEDYVYDVYFSDKAGPVASGNIGYIDVEEGQEKLLFGDSDSEADGAFPGEEDDSNAEDYYKNEYPDEDESDGAYDGVSRENEFGSDLDELLGDRLGDLHLDPEWSEDEHADDENASYNRYGWR